jgi:hypothetical protein
MAGPFLFPWLVDQGGYKTERVTRRFGGLLDLGENAAGEEFIVIAPAGGLLRYYSPLDEEGLWLQFAETCTNLDGVLLFANKYGVLNSGANLDQPGKTALTEFINTAATLKEIARRLEARDREGAAELFHIREAPVMRVFVFPAGQPGKFEWRFVPQSLRDALLYQAAEAISGDRQFRRCRNPECSNWFRLGPHKLAERRGTYTARREFCSDRCRVASARRKKKGAPAHA